MYTFVDLTVESFESGGRLKFCYLLLIIKSNLKSTAGTLLLFFNFTLLNTTIPFILQNVRFILIMLSLHQI